MKEQLKTLKDLGFFAEVRNIPNILKKSKEEAVFKYELKAEAVKWVKHIKPKGDRALWTWIIRFFNLTEEDILK